MFNFEGNAAKKLPQESLQEGAPKIEPSQEPQEEPKKTGKERLRELRIMQRDFKIGEEFTPEQLKEFLQLQDEESRGEGKVIMTDFEQKRYSDLILKRDGRGIKLSDTEEGEMSVLQKKVNAGGLKNRTHF